MKLKKMIKMYAEKARKQARHQEEIGETDGGLDYLYGWAIDDCVGQWCELRGITLSDDCEQADQAIQKKMQRYWRRNP